MRPRASQRGAGQNGQTFEIERLEGRLYCAADPLPEPPQGPPGQISGVVFQDASRDGIMDPLENRLANIPVYLDVDRSGGMTGAAGVEPDDYPPGTELNQILPGVNLFRVGSASQSKVVVAARPGGAAGEHVFKGIADGDSGWSSGEGELRIEFNPPVNFVSIDVLGLNGNSQAGDVGLMRLYVQGNPTSAFSWHYSRPLVAGERQTLWALHATADISYIMVRGFGGRQVLLDRLRLTAAEPMTVTDANGQYLFTDVAPGTHEVRWEMPPLTSSMQIGLWGYTSPPGGFWRLDLSPGQAMTGKHLGGHTDQNIFPMIAEAFYSGAGWGGAAPHSPLAGSWPWATLPWLDLDRVAIRFNKDVDPAKLDAVFTGSLGVIASGAAEYDAATFTASWLLAGAAPAGPLTVRLNPGATESDYWLTGWRSIELNVAPGDANGDGAADLADVLAIQACIAAGGYDARHDLLTDGQIDGQDVLRLVRQALGSQTGDANLDLQVSIGDLVILAENFNSAGNWSGGDFNSDGQVTIGDLVLLAESFGYGAPALTGDEAAAGAGIGAGVGIQALGMEQKSGGTRVDEAAARIDALLEAGRRDRKFARLRRLG